MEAPEKHLLLKFHNNYADEFDVNGFLVLSESEWNAHKDFVAKVFKQREINSKKKDDPKLSYRCRSREVSVGFGTNEDITYSSLEDYVHSFKVTEITQEQYQVLDALFGRHYQSYSYGTGKDKVTIPERHEIKHGMLCLIDEDHLCDEE